MGLESGLQRTKILVQEVLKVGGLSRWSSDPSFNRFLRFSHRLSRRAGRSSLCCRCLSHAGRDVTESKALFIP